MWNGARTTENDTATATAKPARNSKAFSGSEEGGRQGGAWDTKISCRFWHVPTTSHHTLNLDAGCTNQDDARERFARPAVCARSCSMNMLPADDMHQPTAIDQRGNEQKRLTPLHYRTAFGQARRACPLPAPQSQISSLNQRAGTAERRKGTAGTTSTVKRDKARSRRLLQHAVAADTTVRRTFQLARRAANDVLRTEL